MGQCGCLGATGARGQASSGHQDASESPRAGAGWRWAHGGPMAATVASQRPSTSPGWGMGCGIGRANGGCCASFLLAIKPPTCWGTAQITYGHGRTRVSRKRNPAWPSGFSLHMHWPRLLLVCVGCLGIRRPLGCGTWGHCRATGPTRAGLVAMRRWHLAITRRCKPQAACPRYRQGDPRAFGSWLVR